MKHISRNFFLRRAFGVGLCLFLCAGLTPAMAQDDDTSEEEEVVVKKRKQAVLPTYEMKEVTGQVFDAATHQPLAGVRVQPLNDIRWSAMTDEEGRYTLSVPVFVTTLYLSTPDYNAVQLPVRPESQTTNMVSSVFKGFYKDANVTFTNQEADLDNTSALTVENDIENSLNAAVRTISRGGL